MMFLLQKTWVSPDCNSCNLKLMCKALDIFMCMKMLFCIHDLLDAYIVYMKTYFMEFLHQFDTC